ncbi:hypothetical protein T4B_2674 [Trichinella pseudospiralis]|uniref:Uncharacterized protein n=1 Tax=Trichinella pseudospiralis TaxID=6337 RepID=A0A0V1IJI7_TRIPS|nr:hypothetical protein T4B_2674 [Trichinella pseudospiralis]
MNDCFSSSQLAVVATEQRHFRNKLIIVDSSDGLFHCGGWMEGANFTHFERRNEAFNSHLADEIQKRKKFIMQSFIK